MHVLKTTIPLLALIGLLLLAPAAGADPADIEQGETRAIQARNGTRLMPNARPLGRPVAVLPYGTRVRVLEVNAGWIQVQTLDAEGGQRTGWLKATQTVAPYALTQGGQYGRPGSAGALANARARGPAQDQQDVAAAGRQLSPTTEQAHRASSPAEIQAAYAQLDQLETQKPDAETVRTFAEQGRLGRPGRSRQPRREGN